MCYIISLYSSWKCETVLTFWGVKCQHSWKFWGVNSQLSLLTWRSTGVQPGNPTSQVINGYQRTWRMCHQPLQGLTGDYMDHATNFQLLKESLYKLLVTAFWGCVPVRCVGRTFEKYVATNPPKQYDFFGLEIAVGAGWIVQHSLKILSKKCCTVDSRSAQDVSLWD